MISKLLLATRIVGSLSLLALMVLWWLNLKGGPELMPRVVGSLVALGLVVYMWKRP